MRGGVLEGKVDRCLFCMFIGPDDVANGGMVYTILCTDFFCSLLFFCYRHNVGIFFRPSFFFFSFFLLFFPPLIFFGYVLLPLLLSLFWLCFSFSSPFSRFYRRL